MSLKLCHSEKWQDARRRRSEVIVQTDCNQQRQHPRTPSKKKIVALVHYAAVFSHRTPLNFFSPFLTAMNLPSVLSRFVHAVLPINLPLSCVRFLTAPLLALSPTGSLLAIVTLLRFETLFESPLQV